MRSPILTLIAALVAACGGRSAAPTPPAPASAGRDPATLRYALGSGRYHMESRVHQAQEVMGQSTEQDIATHLFLSTVLRDTSGNIGFAATVDSVSASVSGMDMGAVSERMNAARGRTFRVLFSPTGNPISVVSPDSANPALQQIAEELREFLAPLPTGAISVGTAWSDTVSRTTPAGELTLTTTATREHRVGGWEDRGGVRALRITTTANYVVSGSGEAQGQPLELAGSGRSTGDRFISAAGLYLGGMASDSAVLTVNVLAMGLTVPIRRTERVSITRLP